MHGRSRGPGRKQGGAAVQDFGKGHFTLKPFYFIMIHTLTFFLW